MSEIVMLNDGNFDEVTSSGVVVVDFYADWCMPCKMMAPTFEEAGGEYEGRAVFAKLNVDECREIAGRHMVLGVPTMIFYKDGKVAGRESGIIEKSTLCTKIDALL